MEGTTNLYADNGCRTFGGVIQQENKGTISLYDAWNHDDESRIVPVGINMFLLRTMESFLEIRKTQLNAKRNK